MRSITLLPSAKVPLVYDGELTMTTEWYRFFWNIYGFTGTGVIPVDKGGTGLDTIGDHQLIIGNTNNVFEPASLSSASIAITYPAGFINLELGTSGVTAGTYGSASQVGVFTVNAYGVLTAASNTSIGIDASQIISGTIASARISGSYTGITGVGTLTAGTWNASTIGTAYGGTGLTSFTSGGALYATSSSVLTSGTLPVTAGGTGETSFTNGQLLIGNTTGNTLTKATLTAGSGVTITNGTGSITISATGSGGTVTSVTGTSPVVSSGGTTPAISLATAYGDTLNPYASKTANYFLAAPNGSAGVPTFRAMVAADVPALAYVTSVSGTGSVNGITLTGTVTSSGSLTLGGTLSGIGNSQLTNSTISGVALGGNLFNLTAGTGVSFSAGTTYNGSAAITINATGTGGTVTSVAALTLGTTGTDLSSTVANSTTTPVITLNVPTASAANRGALSAADWTTFNSKAPGVTFTTNYIPYGQGTTTLNQSAGLQFDGTNFTTTGYATATSFRPSSSTVPTNGLFLPATNSLGWATNTTERLRLTSGGNLGLGTTDPDYGSYGATERILGITGVATNRGRLSFQNTATGTSGVSGDISFFNSTTALVSVIGQADGATNKGLFAFYTNSGSGLAERMRLNNLGYLGIGSNNPSALLHIEGNIATPVTQIIRNSSANTAAGGKISFQYTTTETGYLYNRFNGADFETQLQAAQQIIFKTSTNERMRIWSAGGVSIGNTTDPGATNLSVTGTGKFGTTISVGNATPSTSGAGVTFPATQSASTDANTLDDYEEGTFTPTVEGTTSAGTGTYAANGRLGIYTKIGNSVTVQIILSWTAHTGTGNINITGLPFTCKALYSASTTPLSYNLTLPVNAYLLAAVSQNSTTIELYQKNVLSGGGVWGGVAMDTNVDALLINVTYTV